MNRNHVLVGCAVLLLSLFYFLGLSGISGESGYAGLSPRFMPTLVGIGLALCGAGLVWQGARGGFPAMPEEDEEVIQHPHWKALGWVVLGLLLNMALIGPIGFVLSGALLMVCVARGYGSLRPLRDAFVAICITLPMWLLFAKVLNIGLPLFPPAGV